MEAWAIFRHAVRMVFGNFGDALRVTGVLYVAMFAAQWVLVGTLLTDDAAMQTAITNGTMPWGSIALYLLVAIIASIWAVVGWHRYVLLEERTRILPKLQPASMLVYFWKMLLTFLVSIPVLIVAIVLASVVGGLIGIIAAAVGVAEAALVAVVALGGVIGFVPMVLIGYRLSPLLPSAALDKPMTLGTAWAAMSGKNWMLLALALITVLASLILAIPTFFVMPTSVFGQAYSAIIGWIQLTVGASIITTLYGVYVEGRELPR